MQRKKKHDFEDIYKSAKSIDWVLGALLFNEKRTWKENLIFLYAIPLNVAILATFASTTLIRGKFSLLSILMCSSILIVILTHYWGILIILQHRKEIDGFYGWCRKIYDVEKNYHHVQQKRASYYVKFVHKWSLRLIKWMRILLYSDAFAITILISIVGYFLPDNIYPDFLAPLPYILPFKDNQTWLAFVVTVLLQYKMAVDLCSFSIFVFGMFYIISFCILMYLYIIEETIHMMGKQIKNASEFESNENQDNTDDIEVIQPTDINLTIKEWIKIIVDMINEVNQIIQEFSSVFSGFFLSLEFSSFGALFILGLELLIVKEQFMYAFGVLTITIFLFTFCYINEKMMDKFMGIQHAIYNIPWYYMTPHDRNYLITTLFCGQIQKGLTAAGLHGLSIERYGKIVQSAYTYILIMKDLIETHY